MTVINRENRITFFQAVNCTAENIAAMMLAIPAKPAFNLIAALVFEGDEPLDVLEPVAGVTEGWLEVLGWGREILLKLIVEAPGTGTVTDALAPYIAVLAKVEQSELAGATAGPTPGGF